MKVAIVGGAPSSEMLAPFNDKSWEIWVLGNRAQRYPRVSKIFEIHDNLSEHTDPEVYAAWLASKNIPLVVSERFPVEGEHIEVYPFKEVGELNQSTLDSPEAQRHPDDGLLYLTSSPAYMLCYALLDKRVQHIGIFGVDLSISDHEYFWQRPCVEHWIGFAKGRGIKVTIPQVSHIGKSSYVEGRDWNGVKEQGASLFSVQDFTAMAVQHHEQMEKLNRQKQELDLGIAAHDGAKQVYEQLAKVARAKEARIDVKALSETTLIK